MYGTIAHVSVRPGKEQEFQEIGAAWALARAEASGQRAAYVFQLDERPDAYAVIAIFPDRAGYEANAQNPDTDGWYRRMRETLTADPEWHDGEVVQAEIFGGI